MLTHLKTNPTKTNLQVQLPTVIKLRLEDNVGAVAAAAEVQRHRRVVHRPPDPDRPPGILPSRNRNNRDGRPEVPATWKIKNKIQTSKFHK